MDDLRSADPQPRTLLPDPLRGVTEGGAIQVGDKNSRSKEYDFRYVSTVISSAPMS